MFQIWNVLNKGVYLQYRNQGNNNTQKFKIIMELLISYNGELLEFDTIEEWNMAIMSILFDNKNLNCYKDGLGGCIIE